MQGDDNSTPAQQSARQQSRSEETPRVNDITSSISQYVKETSDTPLSIACMCTSQRVYVGLLVCVHARICMCVCVHMCKRMCMYTHVCDHACMNVWLGSARLWLCVYVHMCKCICVHVSACVHICLCTRVRAYVPLQPIML